MEIGLMKGAYEYHKTIADAVKLGVGDIKPFRNLDKRVPSTGTLYHYRNIVFALGSHTEGLTFEVYITDSNSSLKVYGAVRGTYGRSEVYGWIHKGNWADFITQYLNELRGRVREAAKAQRAAISLSKLPQIPEEEIAKFEEAFAKSVKGTKGSTNKGEGDSK